MKKRIWSFLLAALLLLTGNVTVMAEQPPEDTVKIYVAPEGGSNGDGSLERPLNLENYQEHVRKVIEGIKSPVEIQVIFRGGEYRVNNKIVLTRLDSGFDDEHRVIYKAYEGEEPVFKGSRVIDITKIYKVSDNKILKRLPQTSRDKVGVIDLGAQGIETVYDRPQDLGSYPRFYLNGSEQMMSQWPNGDYNYGEFEAVSIGGIGENSAGGSFRYINTERPERWLDANDIVIHGFFGYDYRQEAVPAANIDINNSLINLKNGTAFGIKNRQSRRWKAVNLLEEIDMPGEWYIDRNTMLMYYYPPYGLADGATLEMTVFQDDFFQISGASNITFEGLTFTQSGGGAINGYHDPNNVIRNITVDKCNFSYLGNTVLNFYTHNFGKVYDYAQWMNIEGNLYNLKVTNNIFYSNYADGMNVMSGSTDNIEEHGVEVSNNYASRGAPLAKECVNLLGNVNAVGGVVEHNLAHNTGWHVLSLNRIRSKARYNEVVATVRETVDAGAFYVGRTIMNRENEYAYNFFYETNPVNPRVYAHKHNRAIYFDDGYAGGYVHDNIAVDGDKSFYTSGSGSKYYNNITVDHATGMQFGVWPGVNRYSKLLSEKSDSLVRNFLDEFPEIEEEAKIIEEYNLNVTALNEAVGNLSVNSPAPDKGLSANMLAANHFENNITIDSKDCFVDPENLDYRVKKDSEVYKQNPNLISEDFDLSQIGIQWDDGFDKNRILEKRGFRKLYPENGQTEVGTYKTEFMWENSFDADEYRFVLATDPEFKNVVEDVIVPYNYYTVEKLNPGYTDYYWQVTAINKTLSLKGKWDANGVVYRFTTSKYEFLDFTNLEKAIEKVNSVYEYIEEGTKGGTYKEGSKERVDTALLKANEALGWKPGTRTQSEIEAIEEELLDAISEEYINGGIYDLSSWLSKENWDIRDEENANITFEDDGTIVMSTVAKDGTELNSTYMECQEFDMFSRKVLYAFGLKVDFNGGTPWAGLSVRGQEPEVDLWACENYFFAIKPDIIEVQIWSSGKQGIMETFENTCLADDEWHDVVFGAYDCGFGQVMVLIVDGKPVKTFVDSSAEQISRTGGLKLYMSKGGTLSIRKPQELISDEEMNKIINEAMHKEVVNMCKQFEESAGGPMLITSVNSSKYYYNNEVQDNERSLLRLYNGTSMININDLNGIFEIKTELNGDRVTIERGNKKIIMSVGSKAAEVDGNTYTLSHEVCEIDGEVYVPIRGVSEVFNMSLAYFQGLVGISDTGYSDFINQMSLAGYTKTAFDTINKEG